MLVVLFSRSVTVRGPSSESRRSSSQWLHIVVLVIQQWVRGSNSLVFQDCLALMSEPILQSTALDRLCTKSCSSWAQPPGKGQYKTLAPAAYSGICWQCRWFSVSDGHVVDCRNHSPVSSFYKYLLQSAAPESPVLAGWLSSHQQGGWPC